MGVRDKLKREGAGHSKAGGIKPAWVHDASVTTQRLFKAADNERQRLKKVIKAGEATSPKDLKIVLAVVARHAGFDRSLLNPRRQPEVCDWIERQNQALEDMYHTHKPSSRRSKKNKSKRELQQELAALRKQEMERAEDERRTIVEAFFSSNMLEDRNTLQRENGMLRNENRELNDTVARLQKQCRDNEKLYVRVMEVLTPEQRMAINRIK